MHRTNTHQTASEETINALRSELAETREALAALQTKQLFFDLLMDSFPDSIYFKDIESRFIKVNKTWATHRGLSSAQEAIGKTDFDFFPKELAEKFLQEDKDILNNGESIIGKIEKIEHNGEKPYWISLSKFPIIDPVSKEITGTFGFSHDISAETKTEEELAHERDMLHLLLDHSRDAIYFKDLKSRFIRVSKAHPAIQKGFITTPEEAIGKTDFDYFPIEHAQQAFNDEMSIIKTGEPVLGLVECETAPGMPEKWVFTSKLPMHDHKGNIIGTFGVSRDITDIKRYEDKLRKAKDELEEHVRIRTMDLQKANQNLEVRIEQLDFLTTASYEMAQCIKISDLATVILNSFSSRLKHSLGSLCITSEKGFSCVSASGILGRGTNTTALEQAITQLHPERLTRPVIINDWAERLPKIHPWTDMTHLSCCIAIPLLADNRLVGILNIFAGEGTHQRFQEEEKVILTLAAHAAVSLSNAIYNYELEKKAQLQGELEAARSIQQRLTPSYKPSIPRIKLKGVYSPAYEVGGDYLDYFKNDAGCWVVVIADVCGKGIPAALLMTLLRSAFRVEARNEISAKKLLCSVNESMRLNLDDRSFVTAICLIINPDGTSMSYARAGHPRLIKIHGGNSQVETLESDGIALGILPDTESFAQTITELTIPLDDGDHFFIYTDGLTEAFNPQKNTYTTKRLLKVLEGDIGTSPDSVVDKVIQDIKDFTQGAPYHDDLTLIALTVHQNGQLA